MEESHVACQWMMAKPRRPPAVARRQNECARRRQRGVTALTRANLTGIDADENCTGADEEKMRSAKTVVSENRFSGLGPENGSLHQEPSLMPSRTLTGLKRWSIANRELPGEFLYISCMKR